MNTGDNLVEDVMDISQKVQDVQIKEEESFEEKKDECKMDQQQFKRTELSEVLAKLPINVFIERIDVEKDVERGIIHLLFVQKYYDLKRSVLCERIVINFPLDQETYLKIENTDALQNITRKLQEEYKA